MKRPLLIVLIAVILGGGFAGYWFFIRKESPAATNTNTTTNVNANAGLLSIPVPLSVWNQEYTPISTELKIRPESVDVGLTACAGDNFCLEELAVGFRDARVCEKLDLTPKTVGLLTSAEELQECFKRFGRRYGTYDCSIHQGQQFRDACYFVFSSVGSVEHPIDGCSKIIDNDLRTRCQEFYQEMVNINTSVKEILSGLECLAWSGCYINQHPDTLKQMPQNEYTHTTYADVVTSTFQSLGCSDYTQEQIDSTKDKLLTDADHDGIVLCLEEAEDTKDTMADTDSDGYTDLEELTSGYDPNGTGKL